MPGISLTLENESGYAPEVWERACDEILNELKSITPVDTGYCQDNWEMAFSWIGCVFYNDVGYASYLDNGWSSQAPSGMIGPVVALIPSILAGYR